MSRRTILIVLGILTALSPFLGLPHSWLVFILPFLGILVASFAFYIPRPAVVEVIPYENQSASV